MASPIPSAPPARKPPSGLVYALVGCLAVFLLAGAAAAVYVVVIWHPWKTDTPRPPSGDTTLLKDESETTKGTEQATEETKTGGTTTTAAGRLSIEAGNAPANGASYKLFGQDGTVLQSGTAPMSVDVPPDSRCKLVVSRPGYRTWEGWQAIGVAGSAQSVSVRLEALPPQTVSVEVCTATGRRANQWCPTTTRREFRKGQEPGPCGVHRAPVRQVQVNLCSATGRRANRYCPSVVTRAFDASRVPGYCAAHQAPPPPPPARDTVTVRICDESGLKVGPYCPSMHREVRDRNDVPPKCELHAAPPPKPPGPGDNFKRCPECDARNRPGAAVCRRCNHAF